MAGLKLSVLERSGGKKLSTTSAKTAWTKAMGDKGWSLAQLAAESGMGQQAVRNVINGGARSSSIRRLATTLGLQDDSTALKQIMLEYLLVHFSKDWLIRAGLMAPPAA